MNPLPLVIFRIEVSTKEDIMAVENTIRKLLHCESSSECSVLQTASYKKMTMALLLRMNRVISFEEEIKLYFGCNTMSLVMLNDAKTVEIRNHSPNLFLDMDDLEPHPKLAANHNKNNNNQNDKSIVHDITPNEGRGGGDIKVRKRRKYPRQKQEDCFVSKYLHHRHNGGGGGGVQ